MTSFIKTFLLLSVVYTKAYLLDCVLPSFSLRFVAFYNAIGGLLQYETWPFIIKISR